MAESERRSQQLQRDARSATAVGRRHLPEQHRQEIAASWQRCSSAGLSRDRTVVPSISDIAHTSRLMVAATPVLKALEDEYRGFQIGTLLADRTATIVSGVFGTSILARDNEDSGVAPGVAFTEEQCGTNAISTPFETGRSIFVHRGEHYLDCFSDYSCYGAPIIDPTTQKLAGVLDILSRGQSNPALMKGVLDRAIVDIQRRLLETYEIDKMEIVSVFNTIRRTSKDALVVIGKDIVLNNRKAVDLLTPNDYAQLRAITFDGPQNNTTSRITLQRGDEFLVSANNIGDSEATIFRLRPSKPDSRRIIEAPSAGRSIKRTAWSSNLQAARHGSGHIVIIGEPGTGRTTCARELTEHAQVHYIDCGLKDLSDSCAVNDLLPNEAAEVDFLILDNCNLLSRRQAVQLTQTMQLSAPPRIVLVLDETENGGYWDTYVASLCSHQIPIPPLRERKTELHDLATHIVTDHLAAPSVRVTLSAVEALSAHSWPGNVSELVRVLGDALNGRAVGDLTAAHLPPTLNRATPGKRLSELQKAERDAIVAVLEECGGNKLQAAERLGISRSTLYTRIREYRLDPITQR